MSDDNFSNQLLRASAALWIEKAKQNDYQAVLDLAIGSYLSLRTINGTDEARGRILATIQEAISQLMPDNDAASAGEVLPNPTCSFCGKAPPRVRLGAGPGVSICNECVGILAEEFALTTPPSSPK